MSTILLLSQYYLIKVLNSRIEIELQSDLKHGEFIKVQTIYAARV